MSRERYLRQLDSLKESIVSFGKMVELAFRNSMIAVIDLDVKLAERTFTFEAEVDKLEEGIEISISDLLALQQPMASDLRLVVSALKISADLKRIMGLSINIAKIPGRIEGGHIRPPINMKKWRKLQHTCLRIPLKLSRPKMLNSQGLQQLGTKR